MKAKPKIKPMWAGWALKANSAKRHHQTPLRLWSLPEKPFPINKPSPCCAVPGLPYSQQGVQWPWFHPMEQHRECSMMEVWDAEQRGWHVGARVGHGLGTADPWVMHSPPAPGLKPLPLGDHKEIRKYIVVSRILCVEIAQTIIFYFLFCKD